ncbi:ParA family protein [Muricoccus aerilatus]|uniref:ParA family protein n=1 Tax=Muricoccus aerilatus TaxID=452982 RepID=UPI001FE1C3E4|nr:ParA family protein [Roseomonas aerilata]
MYVVVMASPKGGVGKSALGRNLLVLAVQAGHQVVAVDLDPQATTKTWVGRRDKVRVSAPQILPIPVVTGDLSNWRAALRKAEATGADFAVIDTPPSIEADLPAVLGLVKHAHLVLVPTQPSQDDLDSVGPWMRQLRAEKVKGVFVLNRANRRTKSFGVMRAKLLNMGPLCPVEVPQLEEIMLAAGNGLGVMDMTKANSADTFSALWGYVMQEMPL